MRFTLKPRTAISSLSFTGWKQQPSQSMKEKDRERFSIKFSENDLAYGAVIFPLEKQGFHSKAKFIVNVILHYVNCTQVSDISLPQM